MHHLHTKILIVTSLTFIPLSVSGQKKYTSNFIALIREKKDLASTVRFDGVYNRQYGRRKNQTDTVTYCSEPVAFFADGTMLVCNHLFCSYDTFAAIVRNYHYSLEKKENGLYGWGTYQVSGNKIEAMAFISYESGFPRFHDKSIVFFRGTIRGGNEIIDWQPVKPYTKAISKFHEIDTSKSTLVFQHLPVKKLIDSSKAWINMYRK